MFTIEIKTIDDKYITIKHADHFYYDSDKLFRVFNDLNDMEISMPENIEDIDIEEDTVYIPLNIVSLLTIK